jgi:hypothetical protein
MVGQMAAKNDNAPITIIKRDLSIRPIIQPDVTEFGMDRQ